MTKPRHIHAIWAPTDWTSDFALNGNKKKTVNKIIELVDWGGPVTTQVLVENLGLDASAHTGWLTNV